ncbi:acyl-CoA carboxylase epsilon subunit [Nocardia cyriacigeorgica]|uniref:acyl-CoA carboxylase epsilon subunit n=1 Tax=Nocardia cyriacigeorgica TaxID=135487 RepID=UPI003CC7FF31
MCVLSAAANSAAPAGPQGPNDFWGRPTMMHRGTSPFSPYAFPPPPNKTLTAPPPWARGPRAPGVFWRGPRSRALRWPMARTSSGVCGCGAGDRSWQTV